MTIADVISWKFNDQPGMRCAEIQGVLKIVEFPGGIPSQALQDQWTAEFIAYGGLQAIQKDRDADVTKVPAFCKALVQALNKGTFVPGSNYTLAQIKTILKAEL